MTIDIIQTIKDLLGEVPSSYMPFVYFTGSFIIIYAFKFFADFVKIIFSYFMGR